MSKLKICQVCGSYTLKQEHCKQETREAGYKYIKVKQQSPPTAHNPIN